MSWSAPARRSSVLGRSSANPAIWSILPCQEMSVVSKPETKFTVAATPATDSGDHSASISPGVSKPRSVKTAETSAGGTDVPARTAAM